MGFVTHVGYIKFVYRTASSGKTLGFHPLVSILSSFQPKNFEIGFEGFKFPVTGYQNGFPGFSQSSGEGIGIGKFGIGFQVSGFASEIFINLDHLKVYLIHQAFHIIAFGISISGFGDVKHLAPIDDRDKKFFLASAASSPSK